MPTLDGPTPCSHPRSLDGHVAIVTGAARGIGKGIATALLSRGARVLLTDSRADLLANTAAEFADTGLRVGSAAADLRDPDSAQRIVGAAVDAFGTVDALINNAVASNEPKPFVDITADDYELVHNTRPHVTFRLMQAARPVMASAGGGSIVNLGSAAGTADQVTFGAYGDAKEAIHRISKVAAREWGADGIRVNVVCPMAETEGFKALRDTAPKYYQEVVESTALEGLGDSATDIGAVVAFLVGDDATYISGQTILVDGGAVSLR